MTPFIKLKVQAGPKHPLRWLATASFFGDHSLKISIAAPTPQLAARRAREAAVLLKQVRDVEDYAASAAGRFNAKLAGLNG